MVRTGLNEPCPENQVLHPAPPLPAVQCPAVQLLRGLTAEEKRTLEAKKRVITH